MELFLSRLKKRLKSISPIHTRIIDSLLGRLGNQFTDLKMQVPDALAVAVKAFLEENDTYKLSKEASNLKITVSKLKMKTIVAVLS